MSYNKGHIFIEYRTRTALLQRNPKFCVTGDATEPASVERRSSAGRVLIVTVGGRRHDTDTQAQPPPTYAAAAAGVLRVGLIHAPPWRTDPWGRTRERTLPEGRQA